MKTPILSVMAAALPFLAVGLGGCAAGAIGATGYLVQGSASVAGLAGPGMLKEPMKNEKIEEAAKEQVTGSWKSPEAGDAHAAALINADPNVKDAAWLAYAHTFGRGQVGKWSWGPDQSGLSGWVKLGPEEFSTTQHRICQIGSHALYKNGEFVAAREINRCYDEGLWAIVKGSGTDIKTVAATH